MITLGRLSTMRRIDCAERSLWLLHVSGILATQCSVYVVAGFLLSASKDSPVCCVISSLTLNAILELSFCTVPLQQFL